MKKAFTLIEVLIAGAIFAEAAVIGAVTIANVTRTQRISISDGLKQEALRSALDRIDREVHTTKGNITLNEVSSTIHIDNPDLDIYVRPDQIDANRMEVVVGDQSLTPKGTHVTDFHVKGISSGDASGKPPYVFVTMTVDAYPAPTDSVPLTATTFVVPRGWTQ